MAKITKKKREFICKNRNLSIEELSQKTGLSTKQVQTLLAKLKGKRKSGEKRTPPASLKPGKISPLNQSVLLSVALAILVLTILVYLPALDNEFVNWDDPQVLIDNRYIRALNHESIKWMFTTFHTGNWIPLTRLSHALVYHFCGLDSRMHHLINITFHGINTLVAFFLFFELLRLTRKKDEEWTDPLTGKQDLAVAAIAAIFFGIHPQHVESVAWVAERKDLLCALFFLLSLWAYLRYAAKKPANMVKLGTCMAFFILALMSKPMAISLPLVLLILDWWPLKRFKGKFSRVLAEKVPFFLVSFIFGIIAIKAQASQGAVVAIEVMPISFRIMNAFHSIIFYIKKMVWPLDLVPFYPIVNPVGSTFSVTNIVCAVLVLLISAGCVLYGIRKHPFLCAAWLYYLITLGPVLGIIQVGSQTAADRYTYLPMLSLALLLAQGIVSIISAMGSHPKTAAAVKPVLGLMAGSFVLLGFLTVKQIKVWHNSISLWEHVVRAFPDVSDVAHTNLANAYHKSGRLDEAIREYKRALAVSSSHPFTHDGFGCALFDKGLVDEAIAEFAKAISLNPKYAMAYRNLWFAYNQRGMEKEALTAVRKAIKLNPNFAAAYNNLGITLGRMGKSKESEEAFLKALALEPENPDFLANLATTYQRAGRLDKAVELYKKVLVLNPRNPIYLMNLGNTYLHMGMYKFAMAQFRAVIDLSPNNPFAYVRLGEVQEKAGELYDAVKSYRTALQLNPKLVQAHLGLARIFDRLKEPELSREHYQKARALGAKEEPNLLGR